MNSMCFPNKKKKKRTWVGELLVEQCRVYFRNHFNALENNPFFFLFISCFQLQFAVWGVKRRLCVPFKTLRRKKCIGLFSLPRKGIKNRQVYALRVRNKGTLWNDKSEMFFTPRSTCFLHGHLPCSGLVPLFLTRGLGENIAAARRPCRR